MKKVSLLATLSVFLLLGAGCQQEQAQEQEQAVSLPPAVEELQAQPVPETEKQDKSEAVVDEEPPQIGVTLFRGSWFDIKYPQDFTAIPAAPTTVHDGKTYVQTDEAYFTSPDGAVEFFVYSPLWAGDPKTYLTITPTEELVSEKTDEVKEDERPGQFGDRIVHWVTVKAKDGSYYRSSVSIREQVGSGSELHHVFGIKYQDSASYEKYKEQYVAFKESLHQYSD